jgi:hypothetical protein
MRALRGDLFEITDEDPLALAADEPNARDGLLAAGMDDPPPLGERRPGVPPLAALDRKRLGWRHWRWIVCAALICAAAAALVRISTPEAPHTGSAEALIPEARAPERQAERGEVKPPHRQRHRRARALPASTREPPREEVVARSSGGSVAAGNPAAPIGAPAESQTEPHAVEREFGFER